MSYGIPRIGTCIDVHRYVLGVFHFLDFRSKKYDMCICARERWTLNEKKKKRENLGHRNWMYYFMFKY